MPLFGMRGEDNQNAAVRQIVGNMLPVIFERQQGGGNKGEVV